MESKKWIGVFIIAGERWFARRSLRRGYRLGARLRLLINLLNARNDERGKRFPLAAVMQIFGILCNLALTPERDEIGECALRLGSVG